MRVTINHQEEQRGGMFKKAKMCAVAVRVDFNEEEKQIISDWNLTGVVVMEREPPADTKPGDGQHIAFALRISNLLDGQDLYIAGTPAEAKAYHQKLKDNLVDLKEYLTANAGIENKSETFEL